MMQTVVETRHFIGRVEKLLSELERHELIDFIAADPLKGDVVIGTGGLRKARFGRGARGKSGGVRVIYYYYNADHPIFLLERLNCIVILSAAKNPCIPPFTTRNYRDPSLRSG
jgi:hypothetical protein